MNAISLQATTAKLTVSRRQRVTPYTPRIEALGVTDYSVVNHTILPKGFGRPIEEDYRHLRQQVQLWDVSCQRQVEIHGPDAAHLTQLMTPRDLTAAEVGQCLYASLVDADGAMINDPVILKLAEDRFWLSISDSDALLWAKGLALGFGLNVSVTEPDVSPLAVQGPKASELMARVFGEEVRAIRFFRFRRLPYLNRQLVVARSGYSTQDGFEIYLDDRSLGLDLWDTLWEAGGDHDVAAGSPNLIDRIEGGLLSYGNDMTIENNPLECGLGRFCRLDGAIDFIGRDALRRLNENEPKRLIRGLLFDGGRCPPVAIPWPVRLKGTTVGQVTSAIWSPTFDANVALGMLDRGYWQPRTEVSVVLPNGDERRGQVTSLPFR